MATPAGLAARFGTFLSNRVICIAFMLSLLGFAGVGMFAFPAIKESVESDEWVYHTQVVLGQIERLRHAAVEAESVGRAFLVSGNPEFPMTSMDTPAETRSCVSWPIA